MTMPSIGEDRPGCGWLALCQECGGVVLFASKKSRDDAHDEKLRGPFCHRTEACVADGAQVCACSDCLADAVRRLDAEAA